MDNMYCEFEEVVLNCAVQVNVSGPCANTSPVILLLYLS